MKLFMMLFDVGVIFITIGLLRHFHLNPCMILIYGWAPLVLKELPNAGHYDAIPIFFTMLSLYLIFKEKKIGGMIVLGLATLTKFFSGILLPLLMRFINKRSIFIFGLVILTFYLPFFFWNDTGVSGVFQGLSTYNKEWSYNSSIFSVIYTTLDRFFPALTDTLRPSKMIVGGLYLSILSYLILKKGKNQLDILHRSFLALAFLFILSPVGDPWYFCWVIPFLCFFPYRSWMLLSALLIISYLNFQSQFSIVHMRYMNIPLISWIIYVPFYGYLIIESIYQPNFCKDLKYASTHS